MFRDLFFNEDSNILPIVFHSQPRVEHTLGEKRTVMQNNFTFLEFFSFFKCQTLHISKTNAIKYKMKTNQNKTILEIL